MSRRQSSRKHQTGGKTPIDLDAAYAAGDGTSLFLDEHFTSGLFSDCTIKCRDREWKLHKLVLGSRCEFFAAQFLTQIEDPLPCLLALKDEDVLAVDLLLRHLYMKINDPCAELYDCPDTKTTINLVILAEFYGVTELAEVAAGLVEEDMRQIVTEADCREFFPMLLSVFDRERAIECDFYGIKQEIVKIIVKAYQEHMELREWINGLLGQSSELRKHFVDSLI